MIPRLRVSRCWTRRMVITTNSAVSLLGKWLKDHPHASQAHRILRYDRDLLVSFCGRVIPVAEAVTPRGGVLYCPVCTSRWRQQREDQKRGNHAGKRNQN